MDIPDALNACLYCGKEEGQVKAGMSQGMQRYKCTHCQRRYIRDRRERGYPTELREQAVRMHREGMKDRQIALQLKVTAPTVAHWVRSSPEASLPVPIASPDPIPKESVPGWERATISDVARLANVSVTTISNYLNDKGHMREETRLRVESAIEQLHFSPNALVRAIQKRQTRIIGVLLFGIYGLDENMGGSIAPAILAGMNNAANRAEYDILLYTGWPDRPKRATGLDFLNGSADGLIWVSPNMGEPVLERVAYVGLPVVSMLTRHVPDSVGYVNLDNFAAMRELVRHLVELGHRRIAYVGPIHSSNYLDRRDGYRQALAEYGLPWSPGLEAIDLEPRWDVSRDRWDQSKYVPILERWGKQADPPTAILAADTGFADCVISTLQSLGRRIPEDFSVCGFDDFPNVRLIGGGLTTIRQPFRQMGEIAVEKLIALIEDTPVSQCRVTVPGSLIVRATTASPP